MGGGGGSWGDAEWKGIARLFRRCFSLRVSCEVEAGSESASSAACVGTELLLGLLAQVAAISPAVVPRLSAAPASPMHQRNERKWQNSEKPFCKGTPSPPPTTVAVLSFGV